jgi:acetyltransferase-like isoleucine patch superfamily enzyme
MGFKIVRFFGIDLSPEKYGNLSFFSLLIKGLRLWKNEILQSIARNSVILSPAPLSLRIIRPALHRWRGVKIGKNTHIGLNVIFDSVYPELINIGNAVIITNGCQIIAHYHDLLDHGKNDELIINTGYITAEIIIEDNVYIGVGSIILAGVRIGKGSVIAAGSVVNKNVEPFSLVGGVPAKLIKKYKNE